MRTERHDEGFRSFVNAPKKSVKSQYFANLIYPMKVYEE